MIALLIIGFAMTAVSVWFWYQELKPFLDATKGAWAVNTNWLKWTCIIPILGPILFGAVTTVITTLKATAVILMNLGKILPFVFDLGITFFCVANLGFGGGVIGGISGLFLSNVVSCFILYHQKKGQRKAAYA